MKSDSILRNLEYQGQKVKEWIFLLILRFYAFWMLLSNEKNIQSIESDFSLLYLLGLLRGFACLRL